MPTDQAAGLRRRRDGAAPTWAVCYGEVLSTPTRLAHALHRSGRSVLLVDTVGRRLHDAPTRSLFGWRHQLARGELHTFTQAFGDGWSAPGLVLDTPGLAALVRPYDCVVLDGGSVSACGPIPHAARICVVEVDLDDGAPKQAYRLVKTLLLGGNPEAIYLVGDSENCARVRAGCCRFLEPSRYDRVHDLAGERDAFTTLAVRMAHEEAHRMVRSD